MQNHNHCPLLHLCKFYDENVACFQKNGRDYECCPHFIKSEIQMKSFAEYVEKRKSK